ncbi:MAG: AAA family ATPase [Frisingicoccus sp.]|uniref:AAA family ATPase n=1 Tax=Frisingicoccus sp. TaxID=1918627 RepID=UPI002A7EBC6C|nr:AAA family ATPase [Frisingicoccus sp.]MDY4834880.1 AAA family ATPase [Frisingicoccus sp.]
MREFVFGTDKQFEELDGLLQDNQCHVYNGCTLPECCTPNLARIGFERNCNGHYILYIDKGICVETDHSDFNNFIANGEMRFICIEDMICFLRGLQPLFCLNKAVEPGPDDPVYDPSKVKALKEEADAPKMVWPEDIAAPLKKKVFGQDNVIDEIANKIVINKMRKEKKLLVMALIGPTATGKSETAKSLADVLTNVYGTPYGYIEIAGSEFVGEHTVHRFFGAPPGYVGFGNDTVLEPVRKNKKHVVVINEIEKSDTKLLTGLMEAIDTGFLGMADNSKPIDLNECILFFTSNIPIDMDRYRKLSKFEKAEMCRDQFTKHCGRPEISGKIGNFIVFNALSDTATMDIVAKFVKEELKNYELRLVRIDEGLMLDFLKHQTKYGARGIRDLVSDAIGEHLLRERQLESLRDKSVALKGKIGAIEFEIV